jgi:hypothetical protein
VAVSARGPPAFVLTGQTSVWIARHPANPEKAIGWITTDLAAALPALARKLPHYGKYSFVYFDGPDAVNRGQGQSQDVSPLRVDLRTAGGVGLPGLPALSPDPATALVPLPK